jgi:phage-related protein
VNGAKPAKEFADGLTQKEQVKLTIVLRKLLDEGNVWNKEKFKKLEGPIWELKADKNRILCFQQGDTWFLTNGFKKDTQRTKRGYIDLALKIMKEQIARNRNTKRRR